MPQKKERFGYLLVGLIAYLVLGPIAREILGDMDGLILLITLCSVLVIGIFSLQESRLLFTVGISMAIVAILLVVLDSFQDNHILKLLALADIFLFFAMSIWLAFRHLFDAGPIDIHKLTGGVCIYLLLGLCWSILYMYLIWWQPEAFTGIMLDKPDNPIYWDMVYFSFVTLTTLGYGDITPATTIARALAYTEAVTGQLYIAILIGTLVGNIAGRLRR